MIERNQIVDYTIDEASAANLNNTVSAEEVVPCLVVSTDEENKTFSGYVFPPNGFPHYVTGVAMPEEKAPEPAPAPEPATETPAPAPEPAPAPAQQDSPPMQGNTDTTNGEVHQ